MKYRGNNSRPTKSFVILAVNQYARNGMSVTVIKLYPSALAKSKRNN